MITFNIYQCFLEKFIFFDFFIKKKIKFRKSEGENYYDLVDIKIYKENGDE